MKRNHVSSYDFVEHTVHVHRKKAQSYIVCNFPGALRSGYLHCTLFLQLQKLVFPFQAMYRSTRLMKENHHHHMMIAYEVPIFHIIHVYVCRTKHCYTHNYYRSGQIVYTNLNHFRLLLKVTRYSG